MISRKVSLYVGNTAEVFKIKQLTTSCQPINSELRFGAQKVSRLYNKQFCSTEDFIKTKSMIDVQLVLRQKFDVKQDEH